MRTQKILSAVLALAIMLSCIGWTPTRAEEATLDNGAETVTENIQSQTSAEGIDILQPEAAQTHVARLRGEEQENLNQQIFLNQDGSKTMYIYDHPIKYRDEQGEIHDISLDIADTGDAAYPYRTRANSAVTAFPAELSTGITLSGNGVSLRLAAQMPAGSTADTTELVNHRVQRVDKQKVAYRYDADTTIEYALTYTGFKEDIVVNRYTGQTEYNFILYTNGLTLTQIGGGHYLTDESGEIQASIGQIIVFTADERNNTFGQLVATTIKENQIYGMTIVLDADYLADPETKYPIRIDPTVSLTYADSGPDAIEDVVIQSKNEPLPQYGASVIGLPNKGISRLLVRFPGIDFAALEGVTVTSASLSIRDLMCEVEVMNVTCYPYTGTPWTETTAHWNTLNQSWGTALSSHDISYYDGLEQPRQFWYDFDFTALAQQWVDGTADEDLGIILKASDAVEQDDEYLYKTFSSYERDSYKTYFTLTYIDNYALNAYELEIQRGKTFLLTVLNGGNENVDNLTWISHNPSIATVSNGRVTGLSLGETAVTAQFTDSDGNAKSLTCQVSIIFPEGIYNLENAQSGLVAQTNGSIHEGTDLTLQEYRSGFLGVNQMWYIMYHGNKLYSIHPLYKQDMYLSPDGMASIYTNAYMEHYDYSKFWYIDKTSLGYRISNAENNEHVLELFKFTSQTELLTCFTDTGESSARWNLIRLYNAPTSAYFYNLNTNSLHSISPIVDISTGEAMTLRSLGYIPVACSDRGISQSFNWISQDTSVAVVDELSGTITGVGPGHTYVKGYSVDGYPLTISVHVALQDGVYCFRNQYSGMFIRTITNSTTLRQDYFANAKTHKWVFESIDDEYYTIQSVDKSGYYLSVANDTTIAGQPITLKSGGITDGMKWKIVRTESGAYRLVPKSGENYDYSLSLTEPSYSNFPGFQQAIYTADTDYSDEWQFIPCKTVYLYGIPDKDDDHEHEQILYDFSEQIFTKDGAYSHIYYGDADPITFKNHLLSADIMITRSHGDKISDHNGNVVSIALGLNDGYKNKSTVSFYSHYYAPRASMTYIEDQDNLSNLELVIFAGCHTGYEGEDGLNLATRAVECGAKVAIGFRHEILCNITNRWLAAFIDSLTDGATVEAAVQFACFKETSMLLNHVVVCGDRDAVLFPQ